MHKSHKFCPKCSERQDVLGPEALTSQLGEKFFEMSLASDWSKRKEALDKLQNILEANQQLKDGDYRPLLTHLRKIIITDLCVIVVGSAVQCITSIAKRLGKHFGQYADGMCQVLFEKFVEKRHRMTEMLREALDTIFDTTRFESLQKTIARLLKHQNPSVRYEIILFLARSFPKCNKKMLSKPQFQPLFLSLKSMIAGGDIFIKEKALAALGAAVQVAGEKAILPYIRDLDLASKAKIEVYQLRAWEIAKTYNEMKFPNFREKPRKPSVAECPLKVPTGSHISTSVKDGSKSDVVYSASNRSSNTLSLNCSVSDSERQCMVTRKSVSDHARKNTSTITENSSYKEMIRCRKGKKELSLPVECQLNVSEHISATHIPELEHQHASSNPDNEAEVEIDKNQKQDADTVQQFTDQCLVEVAHHLKDITKEHRLITYNQRTTAENEEIIDNVNIVTITPVVIESESGVEDSQIKFTKKELDDLLNILYAARVRARTKESAGFKRKLRSRKHRYTTMSKGALSNGDHKATQCTSAISSFDKPTQTLRNEEEKPSSFSCIINCCDKCTRLLLSNSPNSKYLFPVNTCQKNPHQPAEESSDNTVYRELVSSDRFHAKSESDLIKTSLENELTSNEHILKHRIKLSRSYEINNVITLLTQSGHDKSETLQNIPHGKEIIKPSDVSFNPLQMVKVRKFSFKNRDKSVYSRSGKVSTSNKMTYVTTVRNKRRRKRKRNRSVAGLNEMIIENRKETLHKQFHKSGSKHTMKLMSHPLIVSAQKIKKKTTDPFEISP